jgi:hypothetical protein
MRKVGVVLTVASVMAALAPVATAARPIHTNFHDTFTDTVCGIAIIGTADGVDNFTMLGENAFRDAASARVTFTAANGKSVVVQNAGLVTGSATQNADGTMTFTTTYKGLPEKIFVPGSGPVLLRDAGVITFINVVAPDGTLVSSQVVMKGPHPEAESDFTAFCQVITAALS